MLGDYRTFRTPLMSYEVSSYAERGGALNLIIIVGRDQ